VTTQQQQQLTPVPATGTAQWMLGAEGATSFVGSVGSDDDFAATLKQAAAKVGVKTLYYESMEAPTGTCAVLITGNERSLVTNLAAANAYKHAHVETPAVAKAIADARLYYSAGFFLTVPEGPKTIHQVAKHAAAENKIYCTNLSAPFIVQFFNQHVLDVMPYVDFLFCNEAEGGEFAKKMEWPHQDLKQVALKMAELPKENAKRPRVVVFTQGSDPTIVASQGKVTEYAVPHLDAKLIVDTNGAGDAFVGGFLAALIKDRPVEECVKAGQYAARVIIQRSGCTFPDHKPAFP
jgi:adenosine kinase